MTALKFLLFLVRFQHAAARRRLEVQGLKRSKGVMFQHAAARRRLVRLRQLNKFQECFNTQPPEGGWKAILTRGASLAGFNTQPPEGGWLVRLFFLSLSVWFQHAAARRRLVKMKWRV